MCIIKIILRILRSLYERASLYTLILKPNKYLHISPIKLLQKK